jgi:hypothetical protein
VWGSRAAARGRVFRLGLTLSAVGRAAMTMAVARAVRDAGVFFPDLVIIGALTGAGFAMVYSAATAFELDIDPDAPERHLLRLSMSNSHPADYTTTDVQVRTGARARVVTVAHYRTTDHKKVGHANGSGHATIPYYISGATPGYRVVVSVTVTRGHRSGSCSTSFRPHR